MAITIVSEKFVNLDFPVLDSGTDYLMGYIGDKIQCTIDFYTKVSSENIFLSTNGATSLTRTTGSFLLDGFRIGNTIAIAGIGADSGNYTIADVNAFVIIITANDPTNYFTTATGYTGASVYCTSLDTAFEYYYNLIENDAPDSFVSSIDQQTQQRYTTYGLTANTTGSTSTFSIASNSKAWAVDGTGFGVTIIGKGILNYKQYFRIVQTFIITPVALYSQLTNLQNGIPPASDNFQDRKCLRHIAKINSKIERTNPEIVNTVMVSRQGNTGWLGEFLNGEDATYSLESVSYENDEFDELASVNYLGETTIIANIKSANSTFTTGTTATLHIIYIPRDTVDFINTTTKYREAFAYDRATMTTGGVTVAGTNTGTNYRQIKSASSAYVSPTKITITANIDLAKLLEKRIDSKAGTDRNYLVFVTIQSPSVSSTIGTDRNAVMVDCNSYFTDKDDESIFTITPAVSFSDINGENMGNSVIGNGGDFVLATVPFTVENSGSQKIMSVGMKIVGQTTGATNSFVLEETTFNTSSYCLVDGVQQLSSTQSRNYQLPSGHEMSSVVLSRNPILDTETRGGYKLLYPFQLRHETWRKLNGADCDFGIASQDWSVISNKSGWQITAIVTASVYDPTTDWITNFEQSCAITVRSNPTGSTGTWCQITTFDSTGTYNQNGGIFFDQTTLVVADFYGSFASLPVGTNGYYGVLYLDQNSIGGTTWVYPFSSEQDLRTDNGKSPWIPITGTTGTCTIVKLSPTQIRVSAYLDNKSLSPSIDNYNIRAKLDYNYT